MSTLHISSLFLLNKETLKGNEHLVISYTLDNQSNKIRSNALLDLDVTGFAFVDEEFTRCHFLPLYKLTEPRDLEVIDGRLSRSENITHVTKLKITIDKYIEELPLFMIKLGHYLIILEKS